MADMVPGFAYRYHLSGGAAQIPECGRDFYSGLQQTWEFGTLAFRDTAEFNSLEWLTQKKWKTPLDALNHLHSRVLLRKGETTSPANMHKLVFRETAVFNSLEWLTQ
ncbi:uncharacterized protein [Periplaneta americana]|uniref:uncharacterized protein n=1 Tax=Periplaneta americana TaxID=6978 RepID=UPI0037E779D0